MVPRDPTYTIERGVLISVGFAASSTDPNALIGQILLLDLDSGNRQTVSITYLRSDPETYEKIEALRSFVYPKAPGSPSPEIRVEVAVEFDRSLRLVRFERREN